MRKLFIISTLLMILLMTGCTQEECNNPDDALSMDAAGDNIKAATQPDSAADPVSTTKGASTVKNEWTVQPSQKNYTDENSDNTDGIPIILYYQDKNGYVIPITRRVEWQEGIARASLNALVDNAMTREELEYYGVYPVLPQGTVINGINLKDGTAIVDFNDKLLNYQNETAERNIVSSIVYTLTEFKTINNVKILVNGFVPKKLKYNTDVTANLNRDNVLVNSTRVNSGAGSKKYDAYLFRHIDARLVYILPVSLECGQNDSAPDKLFESLLTDYSSKGLFSEMPQDARLLSSRVSGKVLVLNFNNSLVNYGGTSREDGIIKQILCSARQFKGVEKVRVLVDGKDARFPEGTVLTSEINLPREINPIRN